ncbi:hypothetical protein K1T71_009005 [Dendrolimus kikuchii]|uniref:Uncharacterized protein n=1 Tax=Dendrolimus kikuchii TaxID=765133 RepID=A0ACC1CVU2_9NEOP|nr:hypothetical protein K1T71_009005 [Dendrolimus kikuchii]
MNLGDPDLELYDPTPNIYALFINFDKEFFWSKLASRAVVRWSKRMYSCAGICSYEGRGGLCDIGLSEPLLKLRPRKDLIETLLHEMIHAYLFVTCRDQDRDGHGPNFQSHMHRINKSAGLNISIYHDFHDEVKLYQTHWWRCNGPCQHQRPRFGIVRRTNNRAPGKSDWWWSSHQKLCGGMFIKIKEPENFGKKSAAKISKATSDITKFITNENNTGNKATKSVLKDSNNVRTLSDIKTKSSGPSTVVVTKNNVLFNPQVVKKDKPGCSHNNIGQFLTNRKRSASVDVTEQVRNIWANKQLPLTPPVKGKGIMQGTANNSKNKQNIKVVTHPEEPKHKILKIDELFMTNAKSILKDAYGKDYDLKLSGNNKILVTEVKTPTTSCNITNGVWNQSTTIRKTETSSKNLVDCPVCLAKVDSDIINRHLDECLNKEVIEKLNKESIPVASPANNVINSSMKPKQNMWQDVPKFNINNNDIKLEIPESIDLSFRDDLLGKNHNAPFPKTRHTINTLDTDMGKHAKILTDLLQPECSKNLDTAFIHIPNETHFTVKKDVNKIKTHKDAPIKDEKAVIEQNLKIKEEKLKTGIACPCCGKQINVSIDQHLEECLTFFSNNNTVPNEGANVIDTIVLDADDDEFDETLTLNATGTKFPCPCCLKMIEEADMNNHLDVCLR